MRDSDWSREILLRSDWSGPKGATITTYIRYINMSRHYISNYVVTLTPYSEEVNKTVKSNHDLACVQTITKLRLVS